MKRFKELTEQLAEDYGAIYTYGSDLDSLGSGSYGVHNIGHPESLEKINQFVENFTKKLYFDPNQAVIELRAKLNTLGLDFDVTQQTANEGVYPLTMFGGSFGKKPDTPHNEWHKSDNITEKLGHGLELNVEFVRVGDGMYQVEAEIVPSGLDYEDVEEAKDHVELEGDDLQELKSDTLRSYAYKAKGQVQSDLSTGKHSPKTNKRAKGVSAALSRLDARKQLKGAPKGSQRYAAFGKLAREEPKKKS